MSSAVAPSPPKGSNRRQAISDPQVVARGMRMDLNHPTAGKVAAIANPIRFSDSPIRYRRPPPLLGQRTDEVLAGVLGLDAAKIDALRASGAIG
ncbi:MAG: CoA transferase [Burkholderiales bacterium]|nr:CoA transferase [Burkholderiales bacterium]